MSTGRLTVTVKRRWRRGFSALALTAGLWAFPHTRAWGQTAGGVLGLRRGNASVLAEQLQRFAAAKESFTPAQQKADSHLRRLAWPDQAEAQALAPSLVPPPWQQGAWLHVYAHLHATTQDALDALRARGLAIELVSHDFAIVQAWITPADLPAVADLDVVASITPV